MRIKTIKEKLKIIWAVVISKQYIFFGFKNDMTKYATGRDISAAYTSDDICPITITTAQKVLEKRLEEAQKKWDFVGQKIFTYDEAVDLLKHGCDIYRIDSPDDFNNNERISRYTPNRNDKNGMVFIYRGNSHWSNTSIEALKQEFENYDTEDSNTIFYKKVYERSGNFIQKIEE